jgi:H+-transporting ATPase
VPSSSAGAAGGDSSSAQGRDALVNKTDMETGLTTDQVNAAVEKYGTNEIPVKVTPLHVLFLRQFAGFLPFLIEIAAIISLAVQDYVDFGIIAGTY